MTARAKDTQRGRRGPGSRNLLVANAAEVLTLEPTLGVGPLGRIPAGAVAIVGGRVDWVGPESRLPRKYHELAVLDATGGAVTPGLIDAHTHPLFAGTRAGEFAQRAAGATYAEIHAAGGGLFSTVKATRAAGDDELLAGAAGRLRRALSFGVVAAEVKSGYELTVDGEQRSLRLLGDLGERQPVRLSPTLLAAHAIPPEYASDRGGYVRLVCERLIPAVARERLATSADVFLDEGAFTRQEADVVLQAAAAAGLGCRLHAEQLTQTGAAELAGARGAWSADHLEQVSTHGIRALARAGTVATLLPGAAVNLRLPMPPARALIDGGVKVALGTDCNPGSSYSENLPLQMWLACTALQMTVDEAWQAVTVNAARAAFGPQSPVSGRLLPGHPGDLCVWSTADHREVPYHYGVNLVSSVVIGGRRAAT